MTTQRNSEIATEFISMAASGRVGEAYERHVADSFTHHNAYFPGDRESLLVAMEQSAESEPNKSFTVKQVIDSGDRVAVFRTCNVLKLAKSTQWYIFSDLRVQKSPKCGTSGRRSQRTRPMLLACSE